MHADIPLSHRGVVHPGYATGAYYGDPYNRSSTGLAITADRLYMIPFVAHRPGYFDTIGIYVNTAAAGNARLGVYNSDGRGRFGSRIVDASETSVNSTGERSLSINLRLQAGAYWLALVSNVAPTIRIVTATAAVQVAQIGMETAAQATASSGLYVAFTYAALPEFVTGTVTYIISLANTPSIVLRGG